MDLINLPRLFKKNSLHVPICCIGGSQVVDNSLIQLALSLIDLARRGILDLSEVVTDTLPLDADVINEAMDSLGRYGDSIRTVITS